MEQGNELRRSGALIPALCQRPHAVAQIRGAGEGERIRGCVRFWQTPWGVLVSAEITGLPAEGECKNRIFAFHIHSGERCAGNESDPFADTGTHYNPDNCAHPHHAGDLPPLFGNAGYAFQTVLTDRFRVREIIGKTVVIHAQPDDMMTQPSGNSGTKIGCGEIRPVGGCRMR